MVALTKEGWKPVKLNQVVKLQKSWIFDNEEFRVDVFFGQLCECFTPVVIMNVYCQGAGTKEVIDSNCDIWRNMFAKVTKNDGNDYYKYLLKHGFNRV